jgi:hypothetical protein
MQSCVKATRRKRAICKRTDLNGNRTLEPVRKQVKEDRRKMERPGNETEGNKERRGDRGRLTHTKLPPAAPGDLGSGDRDASPPRRKGAGPDSGGNQRGPGQWSAQNPINDPAGPGCQRGRVHSTMGLRGPGVSSDT